MTFDLNKTPAITVIGIRIPWTPPRIDHYQIMAGDHCECWESEPTADNIRDAFNRIAPKDFELTIVLAVSNAY
jgi:hypothetical protein